MDLSKFSYSDSVETTAGKGYYFLFNENRILAPSTGDASPPINHKEWLSLKLTDKPAHYFGSMGDIPCYAVYHPEEALNGSFQWVDLRQIMVESSDDMFAIAARGKQILEFKRTHRFCGVCGKTTQDSTSELAAYCPACDATVYPRLSPCIIVLITRDEELLLARGARTPEGMYTTLAGFVEAGETLEQCIHREIYEEVGVKVKNLKYYSSQTWPFPHQLMVGFFAEYDSGEIHIDNEEILDAQWWHYKALPMIPPRGAIANSLITDHTSKLNTGSSE